MNAVLIGKYNLKQFAFYWKKIILTKVVSLQVTGKSLPKFSRKWHLSLTSKKGCRGSEIPDDRLIYKVCQILLKDTM